MNAPRAVFVAVFLVLAGCTTGTSPGDSTTATPAPDNPWGKDELAVSVSNDALTEQDVEGLVQDALEYWNQNSSEYGDYAVSYTLVPNESNPDIEIRFVEQIPSCGEHDIENALGCAPLLGTGTHAQPPEVVYVRAGYTDETTVNTLVHELGHTLGIEHGSEPMPVMSNYTRAVLLPQPNATERELPWLNASLQVHVDTTNVSAAASDATEQVNHALDYYEAGAEGTVPDELRFVRVQNRSEADIVVSFSETDCGVERGSCAELLGKDIDEDPALEYYTRARINLVDVDTDAVGWHVGYWLGKALGNEDDAELPPPFRDAEYDDRRGQWWE